MKVQNMKYGPGVEINLTGDEVATAIDAYLAAHNVHSFGPRTTRVNGELINHARVYVDPSGYVIANGLRYPDDFNKPTSAEKKKEAMQQKIHEQLLLLSEEDRMEMLSCFCQGCGILLKEGARCYCKNDE